jgi:TRAP-type uncharacterized transport system substrate-binding protein
LVGDAASTGRGDQKDLESLGTVFYEPLWLFVRNETCAPVCSLAEFVELLSRNISIGSPDSGTQILAEAALKSFGAKTSARWQRLPVPQARDALLAGQIDAAFLVEAWESPSVRQLLGDPMASVLDRGSYSGLGSGGGPRLCPVRQDVGADAGAA